MVPFALFIAFKSELAEHLNLPPVQLGMELTFQKTGSLEICRKRVALMELRTREACEKVKALAPQIQVLKEIHDVSQLKLISMFDQVAASVTPSP